MATYVWNCIIIQRLFEDNICKNTSIRTFFCCTATPQLNVMANPEVDVPTEYTPDILSIPITSLVVGVTVNNNWQSEL